MASGYWHIPMHPDDTEKPAFVTNSGLCERLKLPFGWRNAPNIFQRTIRRILTKHKIKFAANCFDDIIIFSENYTQIA
ncbi:retrotransposable element Tf2 protein type 1 [Trichonephila clavipes]|nr:retrotransposable element Tf2 protein type 1 [Trichonephila clavipes]